MSRAVPDLTQGFTGVSLPKTGPRQMGTDADGRTSVITFLNMVTESMESMHDNQTNVRPEYLPVNGLWCYTAPDGVKTVYQYDGAHDVVVWTIDASGTFGPFATPTTAGIVRPDGKTSFVDGNGVLSAAVSPDEIRDINTALGAKLGTSVYDGRWWLSGEYAIVPATRIVCNHGLGLSNPTKARAEVWLVCKAAEYGYAVGDIIRGFSLSWNASVAQPGAPAIVLEENSVSFCNGVFISGIYATQKNAGTSFVPTAANWRIVFAILK